MKRICTFRFHIQPGIYAILNAIQLHRCANLVFEYRKNILQSCSDQGQGRTGVRSRGTSVKYTASVVLQKPYCHSTAGWFCCFPLSNAMTAQYFDYQNNFSSIVRRAGNAPFKNNQLIGKTVSVLFGTQFCSFFSLRALCL